MHWRQYQELQKVVEVGGRFMSYVEVGSGPALVLLHGMPSWGWMFHRMLPFLERRHRVLIPDLPGFGFSDRSDRFTRSVTAQTDRLLGWMKAVGAERASLLGHDVGAAVSLRLALSHPERVERLCLAAAAAYDYWPVPGLHALGHPSQNRRLTPAALQRHLSRALEPAFSGSEPELLAGLLAPYSTEVGKLSLIRAAAALDCGETMALAPLLPRLRAPLLVLWGEHDPLQPLDAGRRLAREAPRARLIVLPGASHYFPLERASEAAEALRCFLESEPAIA